MFYFSEYWVPRNLDDAEAYGTWEHILAQEYGC